VTGLMRAAVYRGGCTLVPEDVPIPVIGPGELLVRVRACGVCGTDLKKIEYGLVDPPRVFGHEMAGEIVEIGAGVADWSVGDVAIGGEGTDDDGTDDDAIFGLEAGGAAVATCWFAEGGVA